MDLTITNYTSTYSSVNGASNSKSSKSTDADSKTKSNENVGVVYEKSSSSSSKSNDVKKSADYSATIAQLKADQETRTNQLIDLVNRTLTGQGNTFQKAAAKGGLAELFKNIEVDADTIEQAKKDIAEDGYWGVEQTSDRLVSMAQALAGGDKSKADELINAIQKGFKQATKAWGEDLPDICQNTLKTTIEKMENWRDSED